MAAVLGIIQVLISFALVVLVLMHSGRDTGFGGLGFTPFSHGGQHIVERAQIIDLAPTILHLLGLPVPEDMDGKVLEDIYSLEHAGLSPVRTTSGQTSAVAVAGDGDYTSEDEELISDRLRSLGYI